MGIENLISCWALKMDHWVTTEYKLCGTIHIWKLQFIIFQYSTLNLRFLKVHIQIALPKMSDSLQLRLVLRPNDFCVGSLPF